MRILFTLWSLILMSANTSYAAPTHAGFQERTYEDATEKITLALWYPTHAKEEAVSYWKWQGSAARDGAMAQGVFPLLLFSHGFGGNRYNQHYLAEFMARNGVIVAAVDHQDKRYTLQMLLDRPRQISQALDFILNDATLKHRINPNKIGLVGHSLGAYTGFVIAGGTPDFSHHPSLCAPVFHDESLCDSGIMPFLKRIYVNGRGFEHPHHDDRIQAIAALAPGLGGLFDKPSLSTVTVPVLIMEAAQDEVVEGRRNALWYKANLPKAPAYSVLKGAGHYAFLPLCQDESIQKIAPEICVDPGISRALLHTRIQQQVLAFFDAVWDVQ